MLGRYLVTCLVGLYGWRYPRGVGCLQTEFRAAGEGQPGLYSYYADDDAGVRCNLSIGYGVGG